MWAELLSARATLLAPLIAIPPLCERDAIKEPPDLIHYIWLFVRTQHWFFFCFAETVCRFFNVKNKVSGLRSYWRDERRRDAGGGEKNNKKFVGNEVEIVFIYFLLQVAPRSIKRNIAWGALLNFCPQNLNFTDWCRLILFYFANPYSIISRAWMNFLSDCGWKPKCWLWAHYLASVIFQWLLIWAANNLNKFHRDRLAVKIWWDISN